MMTIRVLTYVVAAALASASSCVAAQDMQDAIIAGLSPAQQQALRQGASQHDIVLANGETLAEKIEALTSMTWVPVYSQSSAGWMQTVPATGNNNAVWTLNGPDTASGALTEVQARVVHDGFLTTSGNTGWDHFAILTRGSTLEPALQYLGFRGNAPNPFFYGEQLAGASADTLNSATRGRGPIFRARGHSQCGAQNTTLPCMLLENYTEDASIPGGVITEAPIALPISSDPFDVMIQTTTSNVEVWVWQGGQLKASVNCQQVRPGDARCSRLPADGPVVDVGFAFIMQDIPAAHAGKRLGILDSNVTIYRRQQVPPCPGCPIP